ncbi:MAG: DNA repair exonuclease [Deltaproteobacteria bacterium]|nr:DNA repair exonuclease [Deltaproteobacteria bacterium]
MTSKKSRPAAAKKSASDEAKPPLNVCHLADVHLGYRRYGKLTPQGLNQREVDINHAFSEAVTRIAELKPDITLVVGDLFHAVRPSNSVLTFCFREIKRLVTLTKAPLVLVAGNHETPKRSDTGNVLRLFNEIPGVYVADQSAEQFRFSDLDLSVLCLPHASLSKLQKHEVRADDRFSHNILAVHAQLDRNWISDFGGVDLSLSALSPNEWDYIALGHLHIFKEFGYNAAYSGSTEHTAANIWAEGDRNKGFLQVLLPESKRIFHALSSPREVVVLEPIDAAGLEPAKVSELVDFALTNIPGGADGKIVRLTIHNLPREVYRQIDYKMVKRWRGRCLNLTLDTPIAAQGMGGVLPVLHRRGRLDSELREFCGLYPLQVSGRQEVENLLLSYLKQLEEQHEAHQASSETFSPAR